MFKEPESGGVLSLNRARHASSSLAGLKIEVRKVQGGGI